MRRTALLSTFAALSVSLLASGARADEVQACIDASDKGQTLRIDKRLRAAREQFALCARSECPEQVRARCGEWLEQTQKALPSMVFDLVDEAGRDVTPVRISVDGALVTPSYSGTAVAADPGEHHLRFEWEGHAPVERAVRLVEGVQDRRERVVFAEPAGAPTTHETAQPSAGSGLRTAGFVIGGGGIAGLALGGVFGLVAISKNNEARCDPANVCGEPQARRDAQSAATVSTIAFAAGGALLAGGIVLVLTAPRGEPRTTAHLHLSPLFSPYGGGALIGGAW